MGSARNSPLSGVALCCPPPACPPPSRRRLSPLWINNIVASQTRQSVQPWYKGVDGASLNPLAPCQPHTSRPPTPQKLWGGNRVAWLKLRYLRSTVLAKSNFSDHKCNDMTACTRNPTVRPCDCENYGLRRSGVRNDFGSVWSSLWQYII